MLIAFISILGYLSRFSTISVFPLSIAINKGVLLNANKILFKKND